jgi:hypothetical protein
MKVKALKRAEETLDDANASPRAIASATRAILTATQVNLSTVDVALRARRSEVPDDLAAPMAFDERGDPIEP